LGGASANVWTIGKASSFFGPQHDHRFFDGECFLATHPGEIYRPSEDAWVELDPVDLSAALGCSVTLHVWVWYELEDLRDAANLVISTGGGVPQNVGLAQGPSLYNVDDFTDSQCTVSTCDILGESAWSSFAPGSTTWREATFDLSSFAGSSDVRLRFQFHSDNFAGYQGIYAQDMSLTVP
jgi:hypothetical protein